MNEESKKWYVFLFTPRAQRALKRVPNVALGIFAVFFVIASIAATWPVAPFVFIFLVCVYSLCYALEKG